MSFLTQPIFRCRVVQAHWEQFEEMEALCHKEGTLLCQQPDMVRIKQTHNCNPPFLVNCILKWLVTLWFILTLCLFALQAFGEYVHKLEEIMERKAWCVHSMRAQLQPYLKPSHSNQTHNQWEENNNPVTWINKVNKQEYLHSSCSLYTE